ncbi:glycosyltransferase family 4 protein [Verrucomicrobiota bacterium sgz303538]
MELNGTVELPTDCPEQRPQRARVLIYSHAFAPSVGGSESACLLLLEGLLRNGHDVKVVTATQGTNSRDIPCPVFRQPSLRRLLSLVRWADVVLHSNISLRAAWPLLLAPRPWIIVHHSSLIGDDGQRGFFQWAKQLSSFFATNIAVSRAMAESLLAKSVVLGNGFRDRVFRRVPTIPRKKAFIFVGRLVSSKGADLAIRALAQLRREGFDAGLTIVGAGPCADSLRELARELAVTAHVEFTGSMEPVQVAELLNVHRILLAPSRGVETFGLVALEALACGCLPVVSNVGGLPETVGDHGFIIREGELNELTDVMRDLLNNPSEISAKLQNVEHHLEKFREERVVDAYAKIVERVHRKSGSENIVTLFVPMLCVGHDLLSL